ncbi:hypothetical protein BN1708_019921, partial [Verticillium longisporum]
QH